MLYIWLCIPNLIIVYAYTMQFATFKSITDAVSHALHVAKTVDREMRMAVSVYLFVLAVFLGLHPTNGGEYSRCSVGAC